MNEQRLLNTFLELVRTDSESYFERPMQELVVRKLQDLGARVYVDNAGEKYETNAQGNVMAFLRAQPRASPFCWPHIWIPSLRAKALNPSCKKSVSPVTAPPF